MPWKTEKYVLCAFKVKNDKDLNINRDVVFSTGYLLDNNWQITRDITKAFVYEAYKDEFNDYYAQPRVSILYNGYFIQTIKYDKAQEWLNQHPLPRKRIDKMIRQIVYKKYNERCAYCGCELKYEEMQVEKWVNLEDVAEHLSISQDTVRTWIKEGKLPVYRAGKRYKFKISEVDEWVRKGKIQE